jgi:hypothetical protein
MSDSDSVEEIVVTRLNSKHEKTKIDINIIKNY